ncbi:MAG: glycosyltransferase [Treponema sp.]|nr:glycosyltransferase [Treponema sp.]
MKIALVHYHLRRGGVTSVIMNQARALTGAGVELLIIAGEAADTVFPFALVEGLDYDPPGAVYSHAEREERARQLSQGILRAMDERWGGPADVVHVHNPLIQKNSLLLPALEVLGGSGVRLLLQNHDLAEDYRPDVYNAGIEYPQNCHYAVINSRDYNYLLRAGLKSDGLHLIPNEVAAQTSSAGLERSRYLYPVRAIRRKNIGEALLLSLFIPKNCTVAVTLPASDRDNKRYSRWTEFARSLNAPVEFGAGINSSLADLFGSTVCAISTSIKEGFGFSFLEPWTAGCALAGRRIDYVCSDFEQAGVHFDRLYSSLNIPKKYITAGDPREKMEDAIRRIYESFSLAAPEHVMRTLKDDLDGSENIDFGRLDEEMQESVIRTLCEDAQAKRRIAEMNPMLEKLGEKQNADLVEANRGIIQKYYGREQITEKLLKMYTSVMGKSVRHKISKLALLDLYLDPRRLYLVGISDG